MNKPRIYIDGKEGTTGLQIYDRLAGREDIQLLLIDETPSAMVSSPSVSSCSMLSKRRE